MLKSAGERTPGFKLALAIIVGLILTIPLFSVWLLVYDRKTQSEQATSSITEGWGGPQAMAGPVLVIPYRASANETVVENGQSITRSRDVMFVRSKRTMAALGKCVRLTGRECRAIGAERTFDAARLLRAANRCSEVHHRLHEIAGAVIRHHCENEALDLGPRRSPQAV